VLAKHSKRFSLEDALSIGVDRMQRNFDPIRRQVESWRAQQLSTEAAKLTNYRAFIEGDLDVPKHLARRVHELYLNPEHGEFGPRTMWSLSNAFTSHPKNWTQFCSSRPLPNWVGSWSRHSLRRSRYRAVSADRSLLDPLRKIWAFLGFSVLSVASVIPTYGNTST
jgi:hypothetical protein